MEKKLSFAQKIDIILKIRDLKIKDLEQEWGKSGTLYKAYEDDREFSDRIRDEFLQKFNIKKSWWLNPVGKSESDVFDEKSYTGNNSSDYNEAALKGELYTNLVEANSEYRLVPKTVLDGNYRMVLIGDIEERVQPWKETLASKNELIRQLKDEIAELRSVMRPAQKTK